MDKNCPEHGVYDAGPDGDWNCPKCNKDTIDNDSLETNTEAEDQR